MSVTLLSSGYWIVRFSANQFIQWPTRRRPIEADGFGWLTPEHFRRAEAATDTPAQGGAR